VCLDVPKVHGTLLPLLGARTLMIRKSVFWGLTLLLVVALISLVLQGGRLEKQQADKPTEVTQESVSTPTRVLKPKDLEVVRSKMRLEKKGDANTQSLCAWHEIEILNAKEGTAYEKIQLSIDYMDRRGKVLATKLYSAAGTIMPGDILRLADIKIEGLPVQTANSRAVIIFAEIESARQLK
jgi:hypothetical protein